MSGMPDAVKKQAEEAERLMKELTGGEAPKEGNTNAEASEQQDLESQEQKDDDLRDENQRLLKELQKREHSLKVLQGKYDAEVPRLHEEMREMKDIIEQIKSNSDSMSGDGDMDLVEQLKSDYGESFVGGIDAFLDRKLAEKLRDYERKIDSVSEATNKTAKGMFFESLTSLVPDWRDIKDDSEFGEFLKEVDPFSGKTRYDLASEASNSYDAHRVASFYNAFKEIKGKSKSSKAASDKRKESLVTPAGSSKAGKTDGGETEFVTEEEIARFYHDLTHNLFKGTEEDAKIIRAKIDKAVAEGRVR